MAWSNYEEAKSEQGTLEPLTIKGETFVFPKVPPAKFGTELMALIASTGGKISDENAMGILPHLMSDDDLDRLMGVTTFPELLGVFLDLLGNYGFTTAPADGELPNQEAPTSLKQSSDTSGLSKPIGSVTTPDEGDSSTSSKQPTGVSSSN